MALRNLTSNDVNRAKIGSLGVLPLILKIASNGNATSKQREVAAAVLGNLAYYQDNREKIVVLGGIGVLVKLLREATTPRLVETAVAALWVVADAQKIQYLVDIGAVTVLQKAVERHQPHELRWASRLHARLVSVMQS